MAIGLGQVGAKERAQADVGVGVVHARLLGPRVLEHGRQVVHVHLLLERLAHVASHDLQ